MSEEVPLFDERAAAVKMLDEHCHQLMEHFDSVQIFVNRNEDMKAEATMSCNRGFGNWFARYGQIREWMVYEDERTRVAAQPKTD